MTRPSRTRRSAPASDTPNDFVALYADFAAWSERTFGPGSVPRAITEHIRSELIEIESSPHSLDEWCDVVLLAMDGARRCAKADGFEFIEALRAKHETNCARSWPPAPPVAVDSPTYHIKDPT